jgi:hypothetical protein
MSLLDRETIVRALGLLDERLGARGEKAELFLVGARLLGLTSSREILDVLGRYYPESQLSVRSRLLLEELFDERG